MEDLVILFLILQANSHIILNMIEKFRLTIRRSRRPDLSASHKVRLVARTWMTCIYLLSYELRILDNRKNSRNLVSAEPEQHQLQMLPRHLNWFLFNVLKWWEKRIILLYITDWKLKHKPTKKPCLFPCVRSISITWENPKKKSEK